MASTTLLVDWAIANAELLDLRVTRLTWVDKWLPGIWDFFVEITLNGKILNGRGLAETEEEAFAKAVAETLERSVIPVGENSSGFAAHLTPELAKSAAVRELIERDAFFCHWLTQTPFLSQRKLTELSINIGLTTTQDIAKNAQNLGIDLVLATMHSSPPFQSVVCCAFGSNANKPFGVTLGLGCDLDFNIAVKQATLEALRTAIAWITGQYSGGPPLSLNEFKSLESITPLDHERLGLSLDLEDRIRKLLSEKNSLPAPLPKSNSQIDTLQYSLAPPIADAPVVIAKADSKSLQKAFFGLTTPNKINLARLAGFKGKSLTIENICIEPHPFG